MASPYPRLVCTPPFQDISIGRDSHRRSPLVGPQGPTMLSLSVGSSARSRTVYVCVCVCVCVAARLHNTSRLVSNKQVVANELSEKWRCYAVPVGTKWYWEKGIRHRALSPLRARAPPESHCMLRRMR